jgi:hypothetical protein
MILDRGGFPALAQNHLMHTKLIWYRNRRLRPACQTLLTFN